MENTIIELLQSTNIVVLILGAFLTGVVTSLAPCSLVSVPLLVASAVGLSSNIEVKAKTKFTLVFSSIFAFGVIVSFSILAFIVAKFGGLFAVAPLWAYLLAGIFSLLLGLYSFGVFGNVDKSPIYSKLVKFRFFGVFLIGIVFGLVSTPCASAPLVAIISIASSLGNFEAYLLVLIFAFGHSLLLLIAGASVGFTQKVVSNSFITLFSSYLTKFFALVLVCVSFYFLYKGWQIL